MQSKKENTIENKAIKRVSKLASEIDLLKTKLKPKEAKK